MSEAVFYIIGWVVSSLVYGTAAILAVGIVVVCGIAIVKIFKN